MELLDLLPNGNETNRSLWIDDYRNDFVDDRSSILRLKGKKSNLAFREFDLVAVIQAAAPGDRLLGDPPIPDLLGHLFRRPPEPVPYLEKLH